MKKILLCILFFSCSSSVSAQLDIYLSSQNLSYGRNVWTSDIYPDSGSHKIQVEHAFYREDIPQDYKKSISAIQTGIYDLFPTYTETQKGDLYTKLLAFDTQNFLEYIAIALDSDTETIMSDKVSAGYILSPFEYTFQSCGINLATRKSIIRTLLINIGTDSYSSVDHLSYSNIRLGDCIIPFPDISRGSTEITDSFPSNKLAARSLAGNRLRFGSLEDDVDLFSLDNVIFSASFTQLQDEKLLQLSSTRIEQNISFDKEVGKEKVLFIHQNHYVNPFKDALISGNNTIGYTVGGDLFENTDLFISSTDTEKKRTLEGYGWKELSEGIFSKTLLQEDTFETIGTVKQPKQNVGATTYYAIIYNYDTTAPICETTLFSHGNVGEDNFIFPEYPWFRDSKYGYFVCSDEESGCFCDSNTSGCFIKDERVFSIPQNIPHNNSFQSTFYNAVNLSQICQSPVDKSLFYDRTTPNVVLTLSGVLDSSLTREYISNSGLLYNGIDIPDQKFYNIEDGLDFEADANLDMKVQLVDPYISTLTTEGVSGLARYSITISKFENNNWVEQIQESNTFENYNASGTLNISHEYLLDFQTLSDIDDVFTKIGRYQVYIDVSDAAGNQTRVIYHFNIIAGDIDIARSTIEILQRNNLFADNTSVYDYIIHLKDIYLNPVAGKQVSGIIQSCSGVPVCSTLKINMTGITPIGVEALKVIDFDTISNDDGELHFSLASLAPGVFSESFVVNFQNPAATLRFSGEDNSFLKPFQAILEVQQGSDWLSDMLPIEQLSNFRLRVIDTNSLGYNWILSNFSSFIQARHPDTNFTLSGSLTSYSDGKYFSGTFHSALSESEKHKTLLEIVENTVSGIKISYPLGGHTIEYLLSGDTISSNPVILYNSGELENPVKILGQLQGVGNANNLTERQNITDINTSTLRNTLRKNIVKTVQGRITDTTVGGIKYIDKTNDIDKEYILESNPMFETLVVRNGNIHIMNDFNVSEKNIGIISYIDIGYSTQNGYNTIGNIYIEPNVESIHAFIYADGALISTNGGIPISSDIPTRNTILQQQLHIFGSLFTRNTLAGARELSGKYILPGGQDTTNQSLAVQYDLYYLRRGNINCIKDIYGFCNIPDYLYIEYDERVTSDPPKLFSQ